jgi:Holliday junction resolvasome RuvABC DNA-binding subunit
VELNAKIKCYLTPQAQEAIEALVNLGLDEDLAIAVLEKFCEEEEVFDLGEV